MTTTPISSALVSYVKPREEPHKKKEKVPLIDISSRSSSPMLQRGVSVLRTNPDLVNILDQWDLTSPADIQILHFAQREGLPVFFEPSIRAIVPYRQDMTALWQRTAAPMISFLGDISPEAGFDGDDSESWVNTATSVAQLSSDAQRTAPHLLSLSEEIAGVCHGKTEFGPHNVHITKSEKSMSEKVMRLTTASDCTETYAVQKIEDPIRGTIIFKTPEQLRNAIEQFKRLAAQKGMKYVFTNLWGHSFPGGYVGVHIKFTMPVPSDASAFGIEKPKSPSPTLVVQMPRPDSDSSRMDDMAVDSDSMSPSQAVPLMNPAPEVIGELQFHLEGICDGTTGCPKERSHELYEFRRVYDIPGHAIDFPKRLLVDASALMFAASIDLINKTNRQELTAKKPIIIPYFPPVGSR